MTSSHRSLPTILLKNAALVNEGRIFQSDLLIRHGRIERIDSDISSPEARVIDLSGLHLLPGIIDDQVHFREPGWTHKAEIATESAAAVAGGVTSFMEMPNTRPPALTRELLEKKYQRAAQVSPANYSFFMGASNENLDEVVRTDPESVCGVKVFMGSSTGNMLVDNEETLRGIFSKVETLIAAHCEDETTVRERTILYRERYGDHIPMSCHPEIRNAEACLKSSSLGKSLAEEYGSRFHILHISTEEELGLFCNDIPLRDKRITSEVCVHHLFFSKDDYAELGSRIKCNPAIKEKHHRDALMKALLDDRLDIIATDHAPHTLEEKSNSYLKAPSGLPLIQHTLNIMLGFYHEGTIPLERIVQKMAHAPAECFRMKERGYIREGYFADLTAVDIDARFEVRREDLLYKCGWSPLEGRSVYGDIHYTFVNGYPVWADKCLDLSHKGQRLLFEKVR